MQKKFAQNSQSSGLINVSESDKNYNLEVVLPG